MNPAQLVEVVRAALLGAVTDGELALDSRSIPEIVLDRPRSRDHGDYATPVAMKLTKIVGLSPRRIAEILAPRVAAADGVKSVDIAGPGFLNITLETAAAGALAGDIVAAAAGYGTSDRLSGKRINLEFVSANPTGPVHIGGARWAAVGDALGRILTSQGSEVVREYYFNDAGAQIDRFARSLLAAARHQPTPEDGYAGNYIADIAATIVQAQPHAADEPDDVANEIFRREGTLLMFSEIKETLHNFRTDFDVYFHEDSLHESGAVNRIVERLKTSGHLTLADGAWWLNTTAYGDDKDRVVIKSDGNPAYVAGDLAYFEDKRARGFDLCIYMLGADHHGYIARLKAAAAALGDDPDTVEVLIGQLVNLVKDGEPLRMSKRAGNVISLDDLIEALGVDAARFALIRYSADSNIDLDIDLWTSTRSDNPVYYVQYAHARLCRMLAKAADLGIDRGDGYDPGLLSTGFEGELLALLAAYPGTLATAADLREPHRVARYLESLAAALHKFYDQVRVLPMGDEEATPSTIARLWLSVATRQVLANGLAMLGVSAPERM